MSIAECQAANRHCDPVSAFLTHRPPTLNAVDRPTLSLHVVRVEAVRGPEMATKDSERLPVFVNFKKPTRVAHVF